jgi:hypothetical protein
MPFSIRPFRRFPVQCAVTFNAGSFLKLSLKRKTVPGTFFISESIKRQTR